MTIACVSSYASVKLVASPNGGAAQCPEGPPLDVQYVDYTSAAAATAAAFDPKAKFIRIDADSICARKLAATPVAVTTDERQQATTEFLGLPADHGAAGVTGKVAYKLSLVTRT